MDDVYARLVLHRSNIQIHWQMTRRIEAGKDLGLITHGKEEGPCIKFERSKRVRAYQQIWTDPHSAPSWQRKGRGRNCCRVRQKDGCRKGGGYEGALEDAVLGHEERLFSIPF